MALEFWKHRQAAKQAREQLPATVQLGWALVFVGGRHDPAALLEGLRTVLGSIPIVGGAGVGLITKDAATLTGYECGLLLFADTLAPTAIVVAEGLERDETVTVQQLGAQLRALLFPGATVLLFYDSVKSSSPPVLNVGSRLMDGLYAGLGALRPTVIGAGTLTDMKWTDGFIFDGQQARKHAAVAVVLPPALMKARCRLWSRAPTVPARCAANWLRNGAWAWVSSSPVGRATTRRRPAAWAR